MINKTTMNFIERKGGSALTRMTSSKSHSLIMSAYAGLRFFRDNITIAEISGETGYTESGVYKLITRWKDMLAEGNVSANNIDKAYMQRRKGTRRAEKVPEQKDFTPSGIRESHRMMPSLIMGPDEAEAHDAANVGNTVSGKGRDCLGFRLTKEDELRIREAIRASLRYFARLDKKERPHADDECILAEGDDGKDDKGLWILHSSAISYFGCGEQRFMDAVRSGEIRRRIFRRQGYRIFYEYSCSDMDKYLYENGLL